MRIGLLGWGFMGWAGGIDFLNLVAGALRATERGRAAQIVLLVPDLGMQAALSRIWASTKAWVKGVLYGRYVAPGTNVSAHLVESLKELGVEVVRIKPGTSSLREAAERHDIQVLFPAVFSLGRKFPTPWIGYIFDCQHKHLPQYFRATDRTSRDDAFRKLLTDASAVIVNAKAVLSDLDRFFPNHAGAVYALPFAPAPRPEWLTEHPGTLEKYGLKSPYFLISNQFWVHKDHGTAFKAFEKVARADPSVSLICTGGTFDSRDPGHFPRLLKQVKEAGLEGRIKILGMIPKRDQVEILKGACAVIQPTHFEGGPGGGAIYDAVALGVRAIVSDIPVNREIRGGAVRFFATGDSEQLSAEMIATLFTNHVRADASVLQAEGALRRRECGQILLTAIDEVVRRANG